MASKELLEAIGVCAELTGTQLSRTAAIVMAQDLSSYDEKQIMGALTRCRKELRGRLTVADILSRLDDGRPGAQEAWAIVSQTMDNEAITIVWTQEMATAYGIAHKVEDRVAARMAFIEAYNSNVQHCRDRSIPVAWTQCLGSDKDGRDAPLLEAVAKGRITQRHANQFLSQHGQDDLTRLLANAETQKLIRDFTSDISSQP